MEGFEDFEVFGTLEEVQKRLVLLLDGRKYPLSEASARHCCPTWPASTGGRPSWAAGQTVDVELLRLNEPSAPTNLTATLHSTTQVTLSWSAPAKSGGTYLTGYKVEVSKDGGDWEEAGTAHPTDSCFKHTMLDASKAHRYRVRAVNTVGESEPSGIVEGSGPLTGFTLVDTGTGTDVGPLAHGGTITLDDPANGSFGIRVETADGETVGSVKLELTGAASKTQTESLAPYSLYGDDGTNVAGARLPVGSYTLKATAHAEAGGEGAKLQVLEVSFTVAAKTTVEPPAGAVLTAEFQDVPESHNGPDAGDFTFKVLFSEDVATGYAVLRDESFEVAGGTVKKAKRVKDENDEGRDDLREIHVEPKTWDAVTVTLAAARLRDRGGGVHGGRAGTVEHRDANHPGTAGSECCGRAGRGRREGETVTLDFVVTLNRASAETVTVAYATADGTATAPPTTPPPRARSPSRPG